MAFPSAPRTDTTPAPWRCWAIPSSLAPKFFVGGAGFPESAAHAARLISRGAAAGGGFDKGSSVHIQMALQSRFSPITLLDLPWASGRWKDLMEIKIFRPAPGLLATKPSRCQARVAQLIERGGGKAASSCRSLGKSACCCPAGSFQAAKIPEGVWSAEFISI